MTPEGKIKARINKTIAEFPNIYKFMPVPSGYGLSSLDYLLCVNGRFIAIEAKAPGKVPTDRQNKMIEEIKAAGGVVLVIDNMHDAKDTLKDILILNSLQGC